MLIWSKNQGKGDRGGDYFSYPGKASQERWAKACLTRRPATRMWVANEFRLVGQQAQRCWSRSGGGGLQKYPRSKSGWGGVSHARRRRKGKAGAGGLAGHDGGFRHTWEATTIGLWEAGVMRVRAPGVLAAEREALTTSWWKNGTVDRKQRSKVPRLGVLCVVLCEGVYVTCFTLVFLLTTPLMMQYVCVCVCVKGGEMDVTGLRIPS